MVDSTNWRGRMMVAVSEPHCSQRGVNQMAEQAKPTMDELNAKVKRLENQLVEDGRLVQSATDELAKAGKSGNVEAMVEASDERGDAIAAVAKTQNQLVTADAAAKSLAYAANADAIATVHDAMSTDRVVVGYHESLSKLGVVSTTTTRSEETGKLLFTPTDPNAPKRRSGGGGGGNGRGQPLTVDGTKYASANAALVAIFPGFIGKMGRTAIISKLKTADHNVS